MPANATDSPEFTKAELDAALCRVGEVAAREAFAAGLSIVFLREGTRVRKHPDGTEEVVGSVDEAASRQQKTASAT